MSLYLVYPVRIHRICEIQKLCLQLFVLVFFSVICAIALSSYMVFQGKGVIETIVQNRPTIEFIESVYPLIIWMAISVIFAGVATDVRRALVSKGVDIFDSYIKEFDDVVAERMLQHFAANSFWFYVIVWIWCASEKERLYAKQAVEG